jgi:hypothetical protein
MDLLRAAVQGCGYFVDVAFEVLVNVSGNRAQACYAQACNNGSFMRA